MIQEEVLRHRKTVGLRSDGVLLVAAVIVLAGHEVPVLVLDADGTAHAVKTDLVDRAVSAGHDRKAPFILERERVEVAVCSPAGHGRHAVEGLPLGRDRFVCESDRRSVRCRDAFEKTVRVVGVLCRAAVRVSDRCQFIARIGI